jgi:hypothetical protein
MNDSRVFVLAFLTTMFAAWAGLVLGVSFLSARAKFRAPSISLRVALDVGRQTFHVLSRTEMLLAVTASIVCAAAPNALIVAGLVILWSVIAAERVWLLPVLDLRAGIRMTGRMPNSSYHHALFARLEMAKVLLLLVCSGVAILTLAQK